MKKMVDFLTDLAINPRQQTAFAVDPKAIMQAFGLSDVEQALLTRGDPAQIATAIADPAFQLASLFSDPSPDPWPDPDPPLPDDEPDGE